MLEKSVMIYDLDIVLGTTALFVHVIDDDTEDLSMLDMPIEKFRDLGEPSQITVTTEPVT